MNCIEVEKIPGNIQDESKKSDVHKMTEIIDCDLAKFFITANIPFRQVENPHLLKFIQGLLEFKIDYKPPGRRALGSSILKKLHNEIVDQKKCTLDNTNSVLMVDGWRNKSANKKYLVFTLRNINTPQTFLSFIDSSMEREDSETLAININEAIQLAKDVYNTNVIAIVTDNDSKIVKAGRLAVTTDNSRLLQSTCSSHSGNLLLKSLVDSNLAKIVREITTSFKEPHLESLLLAKGGTKLVNHPDTRFNYFRDSCFSVLKNLSVLRELCGECDNLKDIVLSNINDKSFKRQLKNAVDLLNPICVLINRCQGPRFNVADAVEEWLSLTLPTNDYNEIIVSRMNKCLWDVGLAANMMHHKYRGTRLDENQKRKAKEFLNNYMNEESKRELVVYGVGDRYHDYAENCLDPIAYWKLVGITLPNLSNFMININLIPASTALIEGLFSQWSYIHNSYRNRLADMKSSQLVDIYHSLKCENNDILYFQ